MTTSGRDKAVTFLNVSILWDKISNLELGPSKCKGMSCLNEGRALGVGWDVVGG